MSSTLTLIGGERCRMVFHRKTVSMARPEQSCPSYPFAVEEFSEEDVPEEISFATDWSVSELTVRRLVFS